MNSAFWRFYKDNTIINFPVSLSFAFFNSAVWGLIIFCSFGIFLGLFFFKNFKNNEYYLYYNLGFTKRKLVQKIFLVNLALSVPFFLLLLK